jgi:translation initiation factor IF-2
VALDEFYKNLCSVGVSAVFSSGINTFYEVVEASAKEYMETCRSCFLRIKIDLPAILVTLLLIGI